MTFVVLDSCTEYLPGTDHRGTEQNHLRNFSCPEPFLFRGRTCRRRQFRCSAAAVLIPLPWWRRSKGVRRRPFSRSGNGSAFGESALLVSYISSHLQCSCCSLLLFFERKARTITCEQQNPPAKSQWQEWQPLLSWLVGGWRRHKRRFTIRSLRACAAGKYSLNPPPVSERFRYIWRPLLYSKGGLPSSFAG